MRRKIRHHMIQIGRLSACDRSVNLLHFPEQVRLLICFNDDNLHERNGVAARVGSWGSQRRLSTETLCSAAATHSKTVPIATYPTIGTDGEELIEDTPCQTKGGMSLQPQVRKAVRSTVVLY